MKKRYMKKIAASILALSMALSLAACGNPSDSGSEQGDKVKVGLLHSLTGSMAISEKSVRDAEVLAIEEINKAGGVLGKEIEYIEEDGASEPSTFATKAEKLVDSEKVATVFGCWTSSSRKAVKSIFEDYNALLWYPVQYEGMEDSDNIVYTGAAPNQQIVPAIQYLIDQGYKKFFLIGSDYVFPRTANMIINAQVKDAGCEVVGEEYADMDQTDFASIISKIEAAKPDVIINTLNGTGNVSFFKQMSEKNYTAEDYMTMSFSIAEEEVATIGSSILKGHMVSWNYYQTTATEKNEEFVTAYKEKFGKDRVTSDPAEAAYDAVYLWKAACEKAGSFEVDNAMKFTAKRETPVIIINSEKDEICTNIYIKDNGAGFDMEYADKLFTIFQRLHDNSEYEGSGVGLALVDRIMKRHGGKAAITGKVNQGAEVTLSFIR